MSEANTSSLAISHPQSLRMIVVSSTRTMPLVDWHSIEKPWSFFSIHRTPVKNIWGEGEFGTIQDVITMYTNTHTHTHIVFLGWYSLSRKHGLSEGRGWMRSTTKWNFLEPCSRFHHSISYLPLAKLWWLPRRVSWICKASRWKMMPRFVPSTLQLVSWNCTSVGRTGNSTCWESPKRYLSMRRWWQDVFVLGVPNMSKQNRPPVCVFLLWCYLDCFTSW